MLGLENGWEIRQSSNDSSVAKMSLEMIIQYNGCEEIGAHGGQCNVLETMPKVCIKNIPFIYQNTA